MRLRLMGDNISQLRMFHSQRAAEKNHSKQTNYCHLFGANFQIRGIRNSVPYAWREIRRRGFSEECED
jgi:hypothetical protein